MKSQLENPTGLYHKYTIEKTNGEPIDPNAEYFILRLDTGGSDAEHIKACRIGVNAYADAIEHHLPQLAADLKERYPIVNDFILSFEKFGTTFKVGEKVMGKWKSPQGPVYWTEGVITYYPASGFWVEADSGITGIDMFIKLQKTA